MIQPSFSPVRSCVRRAVTLVEVIFAVGVVLVGLVGLLSVLPLAGRRADDSISLNSGAALAESVFDELVARKFLSNGQLRRFNYTVLDSSLTTSQPFVIDPMFCSGYEKSEGNITTTTFPPTLNGYDQQLFPHYKTSHHPYLDPLSGASSTWTSIQPRLDRVGIASPFSLPPISLPPTGPAFIEMEHALRIAESKDDLPTRRPTDRSRPVTFQALQGTLGGLAYGKRVPDSVYSWFATVNPLPPDAVYASVSVVVVKDRERSFVAPLSTAGASSPEENAVGERVAYVTYASGFRGGAGGIVHLNSSTNTISRVRSNDWVMLSRTNGTDDFHRWYRVVGIDGKAREVVVADPLNPSVNRNVWQHNVLLDGPDWIFGNGDDGSAASTAIAVSNNTYATLVQGVVSVTERTVLLSDL